MAGKSWKTYPQISIHDDYTNAHFITSLEICEQNIVRKARPKALPPALVVHLLYHLQDLLQNLGEVSAHVFKTTVETWIAKIAKACLLSYGVLWLCRTR